MLGRSALAVVWLLLPSSAAADGEGRALVALEWSAPEGCASAGALMRGTETILGETVFLREAPSSGASRSVPLVRGRASREEGRWVARLDLVDTDGEGAGRRELVVDGADCADLDESLHLVLALAVDRLRQRQDTSVAVSVSEPWRGEIGLALDGGIGVFPSALLAPGLIGRLDPPGLVMITVRFSLWPPQSVTTSGGPGGELWGVEAALGLCLEIVDDTLFGVEGCGEVSVTHVRAAGVGEGLTDARSVQGRYVSARLQLAGRLTLTEYLLLRLTAGAYALLESARFHLLTAEGGRVALHDPEPFGPWMRLELVLRIP